jgi:RNA polymerase sigma-70 factor, ECF subfamily
MTRADQRFFHNREGLAPLIVGERCSLSVDRTLPMTSAPAAEAPTAASLIREHAPFAWRVLRRLGVAEADIEDICQEVFVTVHRKLATFEGRSSAQTWLYGICVRTASGYRKRVRARREVPSARPPEVSVGGLQEEELALREARDVLDRILDRLDDDKRNVFVLYEIEELPMAEVAAAVGCPLQTAYSRLHAARREVEAAVQNLPWEGRAK